MSAFLWMMRYILSALRATVQRAPASVRDWARFWTSYIRYRRLSQTSPARMEVRYLWPCLGDNTGTTAVDPVYFFQDAWAFDKVVAGRPRSHVDVGSHHKYVALLAKVVPVTMVDIRPLPLTLEGLTFRQGSILALPFADGSVESLSSLCVVEHVGLGRYGDPLDAQGTEKAVRELKRVLAPGGDLFLSIPLDDDNRVYFNAHRAFTEQYLMTLFDPFEVVEKRYIFGNEFIATARGGFGTGCYHLRRARG